MLGKRFNAKTSGSQGEALQEMMRSQMLHLAWSKAQAAPPGSRLGELFQRSVLRLENPLESSASSSRSQGRGGEPQAGGEMVKDPWIPRSPEELLLFQGPGNVGSQIPWLRSHHPVTAPWAGAKSGVPSLAILTGMSFVAVSKGGGMSLDLLGLG